MSTISKIKSGFCSIIILAVVVYAPVTHAASLNPFDPDFRLSVCDGPRISGDLLAKDPSLIPTDPTKFKEKYGHQPPYVSCDFAALIDQVQFLINAMIVFGVLAAIISFTYAGALLIWSGPEKRARAKGIFQMVGIGFIMMLAAWFIVYQILDWLAADATAKALLGSP